jgi:hypothetical protein
MLYLTFHIHQPVVATILSWQRQANDDVLRRELEQHGRARVGRLGTLYGEWELEALPEPGSAAPLVGPEGAYTFTFSPAADGCRVTVTAHGDPRAPGAAPLELALDHCLHLEEDPNRLEDAFRWRHPQYSGYGPAGSAEVGVEEIVFWIDGHLVRRLEAAGWSAERAGEYDYSFRPNAGGADIWLTHRDSGAVVSLVRDAPAAS